MLKRIEKIPQVSLADADFSNLFPGGLEYGAPARGMWNIVHTGMLIPEAHQIFVCAASCLRGVVLTAAEMNASHRFSTIEIRNNNILDGTMEELITEGTAQILSRLDNLPPAVLLYTSCIHHFTGCDTDYVFSELSKQFPQIEFSHCYMNPIMRKSGLTPDQLMRRQLYDFLKPCIKKAKTVAVIGNDFATDSSSELIKTLTDNGISVRDITECETYGDYLLTAEAELNIITYPAAKPAGEMLKKRLDTDYLYMPVSFNTNEIGDMIKKLCGRLNLAYTGSAENAAQCAERLESLKKVISDIPVAIDYTAVSRPFELAELLILHNINVTEIYADSVTEEDRRAFYHLKDIAPHISVYPTVAPQMCRCRESTENILAIGQKAAYFTGTNRFVNIVENGGHWGYDGILRLADEIEDAFLNRKNASEYIQIKGWRCGCC